jgi:hypothetical protein
MQSQIERAIASITEDRRAGYLFPTKAGAAAVGCHPNKFADWWLRTRRKLLRLAAEHPAETGAEMMAILAEAASRRSQPAEPED